MTSTVNTSSIIKRRQMAAYYFIAPAFIILFTFILYPLIDGLLLSFFKWNGFTERIFVGLKNYIRLFNDYRFWNALGNTLKYTIGSVIGTLIIGFITALALHNHIRGWKFFRTAFFMTVILPISAMGILWGSFLHPINGPVRLIFDAFSITTPDWLGSPQLALWTITAINIWQFSGFPMLFLFTAMENISPELYEAGEIEGIKSLQRIRYITFPLIKPVFLVITSLQIINAFKVFDIVFVMTKGGPGHATEVLTLYMYNTAFWFRKYGYGASIAMIMLVLELIMAIFYLRSLPIARTSTKGK